MQARESGEVVLEPASARWPIFDVWRTRKSSCTKDHEFLARRSPRKVVVPRIMNSWPDKDQSKVVVPRARVQGRDVVGPFSRHFPGFSGMRRPHTKLSHNISLCFYYAFGV